MNFTCAGRDGESYRLGYAGRCRGKKLQSRELGAKGCNGRVGYNGRYTEGREGIIDFRKTVDVREAGENYRVYVGKG